MFLCTHSNLYIVMNYKFVQGIIVGHKGVLRIMVKQVKSWSQISRYHQLNQY